MQASNVLAYLSASTSLVLFDASLGCLRPNSNVSLRRDLSYLINLRKTEGVNFLLLLAIL